MEEIAPFNSFGTVPIRIPQQLWLYFLAISETVSIK